MSDVALSPRSQAARAGEELLTATTGTRLHIRGCAHLTPGTTTGPATDHDIYTLPLCSACAAELNGQTRTTFDDLNRAFEAFKLPVESRTIVHALVDHLDVERIWIPASEPYITLVGANITTVYIGKTAVWIGSDMTPLPGYAPGGGGGVAAPERPVATCPTCYYELPATGLCDNC